MTHYENRFIAFLDILGFKDKIDKTVNEPNFEDVVYHCMNSVESFRICETELFGKIEGENVSTFSDSIVISYANDFEGGLFSMILSCIHLSLDLANRGFFIRGAITYGQINHTDRLCYGPGLNRAYELEKDIANYPRIIIDRETIKSCLHTDSARFHDEQTELEYIEDLIHYDCDYPYVDFLSCSCEGMKWPNDQYEWAKNVRHFIQEGLSNKNEKVVAKFLWLKDKYNTFVTNSKNFVSSGLNKNEFQELIKAYKELKM